MKNNHVEAVCTANLFNFIGDTFVFTRDLLLNNNINIAKWKTDEMVQFKNKYKNI